MDAEYTLLAETIRNRATTHHKQRYLVAIAGIPGSGKTTTAAAVAQHLNSGPSPIRTALLPMDGFHWPRSTLDQFPNKEEAYIRRGSAWTFDAERFVSFVRQLRDWADSDPNTNNTTIYAPSFDHQVKDPVEDGIAVRGDTQVLILEGLYLLLDEPVWRDIAPMMDYRVFVESEWTEARDRLARRHVQAGIEATMEDGYRRVDSNDYLNGLTIKEKLIRPDVVVRSIPEAQS